MNNIPKIAQIISNPLIPNESLAFKELLNLLWGHIFIPLGHLLLPLLLQLTLITLSLDRTVDIHQLNSVFYQILLQSLVERSVRRETRALVHF